MEKLQSMKQENKPKNQPVESKIQPGQDLFRQSLEMALGRKVSKEEEMEMNEILSGGPMEEEF